jgi:DNA mismatch repair protein MutL
MSDHFDTFVEPTIGMYATEHDLSLVIATMACHNSVRMNQRITVVEAKSIVKNLLECEIPFACPHGRKAIWRLQKEEIDKEFMRT